MALLDTITINGTIVDAAGIAANGVVCTFTVVNPPSFLDNYAISAVSMDSTTDENGEFTIDLIQGVIYNASIETIGLLRTFTAPEDGTAIDLFELINT